MKFICLGYLDESLWDVMSGSEQNAVMDRIFAYHEELEKSGAFLGGEGLQRAHGAATLRSRNGKLIVTDGPFTETKEAVGGIFILEARDLNHAVELMSKHPATRFGPVEIRAVEDMTGMKRDSEQRRAGAGPVSSTS
jgi:hypothetical protein